MAKEMDCANYFPGYVENVSIEYLDNILSRFSAADNQRQTPYMYIYADDSLLGGK